MAESILVCLWLHVWLCDCVLLTFLVHDRIESQVLQHITGQITSRKNTIIFAWTFPLAESGNGLRDNSLFHFTTNVKGTSDEADEQ